MRAQRSYSVPRPDGESIELTVEHLPTGRSRVPHQEERLSRPRYFR